jgi:hypothetical protein
MEVGLFTFTYARVRERVTQSPLDMNVIVLRGLLSHKACVRFVGQAFADKYSAKETAGAISESIKAAGATPPFLLVPVSIVFSCKLHYNRAAHRVRCCSHEIEHKGQN